MRSIPIRSLSDFIGSSARFSIPTETRFTDRILSNLLYYQTNYFIMFIIIFCLLSLLNPVSVIFGMLLILCPVTVLLLLDRQTLQSIKQPKFLFPICLILAFLSIPIMGRIILFCSVLLLSLLSVLLHAVCRQRNIKNKVCKLVESTRPSEQKTPMGYILESLGFQITTFDLSNQ